MNFLLPLGLLGLIGIPIILLVHIIKPKYHERTISSTYIWHLAKKYRKKKIPFEKLTQFLLIGIQFLIVAAISFLLTKPFVTTPEKIVNNQIIMIDCSASMNTLTKNGDTRYKKAVDKIVDSFSKYSEENKFSIIFIDDEPTLGNVSMTSNRTEIEKELRENGKCTFSEITDSNYESAIKQVETILATDKNADVTIYTDHQMKITGDIELIDVSEAEWNVTLLDSQIELNDDTGYFDFITSIASYNQDADVVVELTIKNPYANHVLDLNGNTYTATQKLHLKKNAERKIEFADLEIYRFDEASFIIKENESAKETIQDDFVEDNTFYAFNGKNEKFDVQLISPNRQIFTSAIYAIGGCNDIIYAKDVSNFSSNGFDLYIFDGVSTTNLPTDGSIWISNPNPNIQMFDGAIRTGSVISEHSNVIVNTSFNNKKIAGIVDHFKSNVIYVNRYVNIDYNPEIFEVCMTTENGSPLVLAGKVGLINVCIFAFDLSYSNLGASFFMPILAKNMFNYSVNRVVSKQFYDVGETIDINAKSSTDKIEIVHDGQTNTFGLEALKQGVSYKLDKAGVYTVISYSNDKVSERYSFFAGIANNESNFTLKHKMALGERVGVDGETHKVSRDNKDISLYFAIALLALLVIEWGVQYREQY